MKLPLEIVFRNLEPSEAIEARVRERAEKLERFHQDIMSCRVVIETDHKHHHKGNLYHVRIDLTVPGAELVANRQPYKNHAYEDVYVAIRDAFDAIRRQLEDYVRRRRGHVKHHEPPPQGRIVELHPEGDFGRIETPDGRLIYFHRNSVIDADFDKLDVGVPVRFAEEQGALGPQASTVRVENGRHPTAG
ncbi:MAG TPA: HPF/RaiA family ribosome-associated protein [Gammaproteobacteria bacterium]|nr:HPF/RaiA family ribosome-associated protein [Gammaproteobacteria bacterium]